MADHMQKQLERAIRIATSAHAGQVDKAGEPYILHPLRLMVGMTDPNLRVTAVLHDVLEDSEFREEDLHAEGIDGYFINAVAKLSRSPETPYMEYIRELSHWNDVVQVKIADLRDNIRTERLLHRELTQKDLDRIKKYHAALRFLL